MFLSQPLLATERVPRSRITPEGHQGHTEARGESVSASPVRAAAAHKRDVRSCGG